MIEEFGKKFSPRKGYGKLNTSTYIYKMNDLTMKINCPPSGSVEDIIFFLRQSLQQIREETIKEMIKLSDTIESQHETEFNVGIQ